MHKNQTSGGLFSQDDCGMLEWIFEWGRVHGSVYSYSVVRTYIDDIL